MKKMLISILSFVFLSTIALSYDTWTSGGTTVYWWKGNPFTTPGGSNSCTDDNESFCKVIKVQTSQVNVGNGLIEQGTRINLFIYDENQTQKIGNGTGYLNVILTSDYYLDASEINFQSDSLSSSQNNYTVWLNAPAPEN